MDRFFSSFSCAVDCYFILLFKISSMNNLQLINYIKLREAWKETLRAKSHSLASICSGLFNFAIFLAYWAIEKIFLKKEIEGLYRQNPNYKYIFYFSLVLGIWGLVNALWAAYNYFQASQQAEQLTRQVEATESQLLS